MPQKKKKSGISEGEGGRGFAPLSSDYHTGPHDNENHLEGNWRLTVGRESIIRWGGENDWSNPSLNPQPETWSNMLKEGLAFGTIEKRVSLAGREGYLS